jgi:hypothetical protein
MKNLLKFAVVFVVLAFASMSCKRCYQCVVREDASDSLRWAYKEVCVSKKDYDAYKDVCKEDAANGSDETTTLYCDCAENLVIE